MVNHRVFMTFTGREPEATNEAGGSAFEMNPKHAIAQFAVTGCFNNTYYTTGKDQLSTLKSLLKKLPQDVDTFTFLLKLAIYSRENAFMKDMPAYLMAYTGDMIKALSGVERNLYERVFHRVINNGKMIRNFVQIIRSGAVGRKSLGSFLKRMVNTWLTTTSPRTLFRNSIGNNPSMADVIKMTHPRAKSRLHNYMFKYLLGKNVPIDELPPMIYNYEVFKRSGKDGLNPHLSLPEVNFEFLTSLPLAKTHWCELAKHATWQQTIRNLNTFKRHGVFETKGMADVIAGKLEDEIAVAKAKAMPYQIFAAIQNTEDLPYQIRDALENALEASLRHNTPVFTGPVDVFVDSSGSMGSSATGGYNSKISCYQVASLFAAAIYKANPQARIYAYDTDVYKVSGLYHRDSLSTIHRKIMDAGQHGGTDTSVCFRYLQQFSLQHNIRNVVVLSDNESWAHGWYGTNPQQEYDKLLRCREDVKLLAIDLAAYRTTQFDYKPSVLHVGGFNDSVFDLANRFFNTNESDFVKAIEEVTI